MVSLAPVTAYNWRDIARVRAADHQRGWVADVTYYRCLSAYGGLWRSCGVLDDLGGEQPRATGTVTARLRYDSLGFVETGELSDDEIAPRRPRAHAP